MSYVLRFKKRLLDFVKKNRKELILLLLVLLAAFLLRLWSIDAYMDFKGDEGRDMRVVRRLLVDFDPILIGPRTSVGDMYLGPLYYYLIAPSLAFSFLSPVGPSIFVALLGVVTVGLVWWVGREWFGRAAGLAASLLYAVSPVVIENTRDSWNPNVMPFFALLAIYSIWRVWTKREYKWLLVLGVAYAFVLQSHYLGLLLLPTIGIVWLTTARAIRKTQNVRKFLSFSFLSFVVFAFLMSPLVIFDWRHGWRNFQAMARFFTERQTTVSAKPWNSLPELWPLWKDHIVERLLVGKSAEWALPVAAILLFSALWLAHRLYEREKGIRLQALGLLVLWIAVGLVGLGVYKQSIFDHYFGFIFPAPFLLLGALVQKVWDRKFQWLAVALVLGLAWVNLQNNPLKHPPNRELARVQEIDRKIIEESEGEPFNFGLIAKRNHGEGYLYFFELWGAPVREIDPQRINETLTRQLFVVCEDHPTDENPEPCKPINHPKAEIANFGWAQIEEQWEIAGVKLFKLVHAQ